MVEVSCLQLACRGGSVCVLRLLGTREGSGGHGLDQYGVYFKDNDGNVSTNVKVVGRRRVLVDQLIQELKKGAMVGHRKRRITIS